MEIYKLKQVLSLNVLLSAFVLFNSIFFNLAYAEASLKAIPKFASVAEMYEQKNLAACSLFAGGFINFGYWKNVPNANISVEERIESEKNLYRYALQKLSVTENDKILEIGCGQGAGTTLAFLEFHPKEIWGIDFSELQIARAQSRYQELLERSSGKIHFQRGNAEHVPSPSANFDKVFSIEAVQHFNDLTAFSSEAFRVLKPGGELAVATFFATSKDSSKLLPGMIQTIADGIDYATPVSTFKAKLEKAGFKNIRVESIGKHVWLGFDKWIAQGDFKDSWNRNWIKAYKDHLVDYYIIMAQK